MANTLTSNIGAVWKESTESFLNNVLIARSIATVMYPTNKDGNTIHWPYTPTQRVQTYTPGSDLTIDAVVSADSTMTLAQMAASAFSVDRIQQAQVTTEWVVKQGKQSAYELGNRIDQYTINKGVTLANSNNTVTGGSLSASNIVSTMTTAEARLTEANAFGSKFAVVSPGVLNLLTQANIGNGFVLADASLKNGFVGVDSLGFRIYVSNNLPSSVTLTVDTEPTATNTMTIAGVTFTFVANGTAANPGEISLDNGGTVTDTQLVIRNAINGTGTPGASTYIELSTEDRRRLQSKQISCAAFAGNAAVITGYGRLNPSETFTAGTNVFGTVTTEMLTGVTGAISLGIQKEIFTEIKDEPKQFAVNYLTGVLFDATVFYRDTFKLAKITHNEV